MNSKQMYFGFIALIGLLFITVLIGAYGVNGLLVKRANTLMTLKTKNEAQAQEQQRFELAKRDIKKYSDLEQIAKAVVPQDKNQAEAVQELVKIAAANGVVLGSITFPPSTLGGGAGPVSSSSAVTPSASPSNAGGGQNKLSQLLPVKGIPGVYQLTITISSDQGRPITYNQLLSFLSALEHNRRTAQVSSISIHPSTATAQHTTYTAFTITLNEYIKP